MTPFTNWPLCVFMYVSTRVCRRLYPLNYLASPEVRNSNKQVLGALGCFSFSLALFSEIELVYLAPAWPQMPQILARAHRVAEMIARGSVSDLE